MSDYKKDLALARPTGKRYKSVDDLMPDCDLSPEVQAEGKATSEARRLTLQLAVMRTKAGVTQADMAKRLGCTQGAVSKLENGLDEDVTVKQLRIYAEVTKTNLGFAVGRPPNHVEAIKLCALGIRRHMKELAKLAHHDENIERGIQAFFGEAFFNILEFLSECQQDMPNGNEIQLRMEVMDSAKPFALLQPLAIAGESKSKAAMPKEALPAKRKQAVPA